MLPIQTSRAAGAGCLKVYSYRFVTSVPVYLLTNQHVRTVCSANHECRRVGVLICRLPSGIVQYVQVKWTRPGRDLIAGGKHEVVFSNCEFEGAPPNFTGIMKSELGMRHERQNETAASWQIKPQCHSGRVHFGVGSGWIKLPIHCYSGSANSQLRIVSTKVMGRPWSVEELTRRSIHIGKVDGLPRFLNGDVVDDLLSRRVVG